MLRGIKPVQMLQEEIPIRFRFCNSFNVYFCTSSEKVVIKFHTVFHLISLHSTPCLQVLLLR